MKTKFFSIATFVLAGLLAAASSAHAGTLDDVKQRGTLKCGISGDLPAFAYLDSEGNWKGFDVDYCRAYAAAVLGSADKVELVPITWNQIFTALGSGAVDVLSRSVTYTIQRDTQLGINFAPPNMYTGQGFLVRKDSGVEKVADLDGATICVLSGSVTERILADYFKSHGMSFKPVAIESDAGAYAAFQHGRCDAVTQETITMGIVRASFKNPEESFLLPEVIAKSYEAPVVREGDDQWTDIISWVHYALVTAEELGLNQGNIEDQVKNSDDLNVMTFVGKSGDIGSKMGLSNDWTVDVIRDVGNYGDIYSRNLGEKAGLNVPRGMNDLYENGGLLFAPSWF
ncbi:MAG: amino acid ABC transporter substrate-binding protein [Porticoccaceae bacterium]|nr:amino acid ABC transporter substrate-binding protein [Porticoccaceae bacterium]